MSHSLSEEAQVNQSHVSDGESSDKEERRNAEPASLLKVKVSHQSAENVREKNDSIASDSVFLGAMRHNPIQSSSPSKPIDILNAGSEDEQISGKESSSSEDIFIDNSPKSSSLTSEDQKMLLVSQRDLEIDRDHMSTGSFVTCYSTSELEKSSPEESVSSTLEESQVTVNKSLAASKEDSLTMEKDAGDHPGDMTAEDRLEMLDITEGDTQIHVKDSDGSKVITQSYESTDTESSPSTKSGNITDWTLTLNANPLRSSSKLVQMVLYVHNVKGLVLSLIAESDFKYIKETIQDVVSMEYAYIIFFYFLQYMCRRFRAELLLLTIAMLNMWR